MNHGLLLIQPKSGGGGDAIAPRPPFSGGPLAETYDSCTAVLRYYPRAAAALTLAKK